MSTSRAGQGGMMGTTNSSGITERDLMNCELRASLPGYLANPIPLAGRRMLDNPEVGTFILHPLAGVVGFTFSATSGLAPKDAKKSFEKGTQQLAKRKLPDAQKELEKAVGIYPMYAAAWSALGSTYLAQESTERALEAFNKSVEADERFVTPYLELMQIYARRNDWEAAARASHRVIQLNAVQFPQAFYMNAAANFNLKNYADAESAAREAMRLDTNHRFSRAEYLLGLTLAIRNENAEAAEHLRNFVARTPGATEMETVKKQLAEVERRLAPAPPAN
jgi:tetratricopeptide (TPR) repeat protein